MAVMSVFRVVHLRSVQQKCLCYLEILYDFMGILLAEQIFQAKAWLNGHINPSRSAVLQYSFRT